MRWFRSNLHLGSRFALLALAVQVILSFGHVHLGNLASASTVTTIESSTALPSVGIPSHTPHGSPDTDCPICALLQLMATSAASVAPALPLPPRFGSIRLQAPAELAAKSSPHSLFQARAPPAA